MQISLREMLIAVIFVAILLFFSFVLPFAAGWLALMVVSLFVFPAILFTGAIYTRGARQAFFIGCILTGALHYFVNFFFAFTLIMQGEVGEIFMTVEEVEAPLLMRSMTLICYGLALIGGISAWCAYNMFVPKSKSQPPASGIDNRHAVDEDRV